MSRLKDLHGWLVECERVVDHVSDGGGLPYKTLIVQWRVCWTYTLPRDAGRVGERAAEPEDRLELLVPAEVDERYKTYRITELQNISFLFTETNTALVTLSPPPPFCQENWS